MGIGLYDAHVVSFLELRHVPYTGVNPRGLLLAHDKALTKKILSFHRIRCPRFAVFQKGKRVRRPAKLEFPLIVKSLAEHASQGIAQASIVHDDEALAERVEFIHRNVSPGAIAEQYIPGRELTVGVMGNQRLEVFPVWELFFDSLPASSEPIATSRVKWDYAYQQKIGLRSGPAEGLDDALQREIQRTARRIYKALGLSGYTRIDLGLSEDVKVYVIEANPNPDL
ncbi:MAG: D-alanine--D-alanine ligase family protein, partial [Planctomycetota bacterium]